MIDSACSIVPRSDMLKLKPYAVGSGLRLPLSKKTGLATLTP
jgi:hypothetical protein